MKKTFIGLIAVLFFALITVGSFFWLWTTSKTEVPEASATAGKYSIIEIESVKKEAVDILSGLQNVAGVPIGVPTEKMGRENPFLNY